MKKGDMFKQIASFIMYFLRNLCISFCGIYIYFEKTI